MKTVELVPTWTAALHIVSTLLCESRNHVRGVKNQQMLTERIKLLNDTFAPLCAQVDEMQAKAKEAEAKEAEAKATAARDYLDCGHTSANLNADMKCNVCGCDANVPF